MDLSESGEADIWFKSFMMAGNADQIMDAAGNVLKTAWEKRSDVQKKRGRFGPASV
jgi:hypothetical protein